MLSSILPEETCKLELELIAHGEEKMLSKLKLEFEIVFSGDGYPLNMSQEAMELSFYMKHK